MLSRSDTSPHHLSDQNGTDAERRALPRLKVFKGAHITFGSGPSSLDGIVRDLTREGVRVVFADVPRLPDQVMVTVGEEGKPRRARKVWQRGMQIGLSFTS